MAGKELKYTLAFIFQRAGSEKIDKEEFIYGPPADLGWFTSSEAKHLLNIARKEGLVNMDGDLVKIEFDPKSVNIPLGFEPSKRILEEKKKPLFKSMLDDVVMYSHLDRQDVMSRVNVKQDEMNIEIEAALLLLARELELDLPKKQGYIEAVRKKVRGR
ncbi:MAG: DUF2240 family protein [Candidatus Saliniplasma sp.]